MHGRAHSPGVLPTGMPRAVASGTTTLLYLHVWVG